MEVSSPKTVRWYPVCGKISYRAVGVILFSIFFGVCLPSVDTGTDVFLSYRLFVNGHPRWALSVLGPVILNTLLTLVASTILEKKKCVFYFPLVLLQIYPQFCVVRLMFRFLLKATDEIDYIRDSETLDGGLGCLEPYTESVPQAYIQTAFFFVANSLFSTVERLCFNERDHSCGDYDICSELNKCSTLGFDNNNCKAVGYEPYGYKNDEEQAECIRETKNCTIEFDKCIQPLMTCLQACQTNLTEDIMKIDETELFYSFTSENHDWRNNTLVTDFTASKEDLKRIQLFLLFIGNVGIYMATYIISIFAAANGVTKFFRLSHSRFTGGFTSGSFIGTFIITTIFLIGKGYVLAVMVQVHTRPLWESTCWWLLFAMAPSFILAISVMFWNTCFVERGMCPQNYATNMVLKQPPLLVAPCVTPFTYGLVSTIDKDKEPKELENGKLMKSISLKGQFQVSIIFTIVNCIITIMSITAGLIWKGEQNMAVTFAVACPAILIFPVLLFIFLDKVLMSKRSTEYCLKHGTKDCTDCCKFYGFYVQKYKYYEVCQAHHFKMPCEDCNFESEESKIDASQPSLQDTMTLPLPLPLLWRSWGPRRGQMKSLS